MELEICTKTQNFREKLRGKFPLSTRCLSMVNISCLVLKHFKFSEIRELKRSLVEGQQLQQKDKKRKRNLSGKKNEKPKVVGRFTFWKISKFLFVRIPEQKID